MATTAKSISRDAALSIMYRRPFSSSSSVEQDRIPLHPLDSQTNAQGETAIMEEINLEETGGGGDQSQKARKDKRKKQNRKKSENNALLSDRNQKQEA